MTEDQARQALALINGTYLFQAAEICRADPAFASVALHLSDQERDHLAAAAPVDLLDLVNASPCAFMSPHPSLVAMMTAPGLGERIASVQAAIERRSGEG
ncbi:MAG: hypothetical protein OEU92_20640 [Alphaproteobacteria bacterium]|nr:hypothetical protein [Alphaproteobacteria bacterium]